MKSQISVAEKLLAVSVIIFCTTVLLATPWPSAHQLFNPHAPAYVSR